MTDMRRQILLDSNIVLALQNHNHAKYRLIGARLIELLRQGNELLVSPQTIYEFYAVASRPLEVNGLGLTPAEADRQVTGLRTQFGFWPDPPDLVDHWQGLISKHSISGKPAHDARQAAWLLAHGLQHIYTLNVRDFARFAPDVLCLD